MWPALISSTSIRPAMSGKPLARGRKPRRSDASAGEIGDRAKAGEPAAGFVFARSPHAPLEAFEFVDDAEMVVAVVTDWRGRHGVVGNRNLAGKLEAGAVDAGSRIADVVLRCGVGVDEIDRDRPSLDIDVERTAGGKVVDHRARVRVRWGGRGDRLIPRTVDGEGAPRRRRRVGEEGDGDEGEQPGKKAARGEHGMMAEGAVGEIAAMIDPNGAAGQS